MRAIQADALRHAANICEDCRRESIAILEEAEERREMSPEQQRIAIALSMGYTGCVDEKCYVRKAKHLHTQDGRACFPESYSTIRYPDYLNDLNAMHEVEKHIEDADAYENMLADVCCSVPEGAVTKAYLFHATAAQRAEAYLRTIGKWEDKK